jgi:hypothetical protein
LHITLATTIYDTVRFQVLTEASKKMTVFLDVAPCRALMMEATRTSETTVNFYQTTRRRNIPEHCHLQVLILISDTIKFGGENVI